MKVAIVHDQLREFGGAERVLVVLKKMFPDAPIFTSTADIKSLGSLGTDCKNWDIRISWFGKLPLINKLYSPFRFLTPLIWQSFDFSKFDLVISSTGSWMSKGIKTKHPTVHISYIHHPPRYLYGYETAIEWQKHLVIKIYGSLINHFLRIWDYESSQRPDYLIANSEETKRRIQKFYHRDSTVVYPPVKIPEILNFKFQISNEFSNNKLQITNNYYITVSRLARTKHIDIIIQAANKQKFNLKIVGGGRDEKYLKSIAGDTVEFVGNVSDEKLANLYKNARAFLFASVDEEFGIAPVEAMGYGLPVVAYRSGGLPETVSHDVNGYLFDELSSSSLISQIKNLENLSKEKYIEMRKQARIVAEKFTEEKFIQNLRSFISNSINRR